MAQLLLTLGLGVTHSETNAGYGSRVVHLLDGKVKGEESP